MSIFEQNDDTDYIFKIADEDWEFEEIFKLNYETFVEEIPQHERSPDKKLIDKYHDENTYLICINETEKKLLGMVTVRAKRPFSLDHKLPDMDKYLPPFHSICEVRLLAVRKSYRYSKISYGLLQKVIDLCKEKHHDLAVISGTVRQIKLYRGLGFVPFGPLVGTEDAAYQPMYLTEEACDKIRRMRGIDNFPVSLLPGPVEISAHVHDALNELTISHRSEEFLIIHQELKKCLCNLVSSEKVELFMGSGTLANDVIAGQISLLDSKGIILSNGEFGNRLIDHGRRFNLDCDALTWDWGEVVDFEKVKQHIREKGDIKWLWCTHCETSTGIMNDMTTLKEICRENNIHLCLDCISSIGTVDVDLSDVYLASGVSGKALGSFAGITMVFYNHELDCSENHLPKYLDLYKYAAEKGVPYTISSNLVNACYSAIKDMDIHKRVEQIREISVWLKEHILEMGGKIICTEEHSSPAVITICIPEKHSSNEVGLILRKAGYFLSFESQYLLERNWIQICLMGDITRKRLNKLLKVLSNCYSAINNK